MARVFIFTNTFPPEFGAAASRLYDLANGLQRAGHDVEVFTGMPNYPKGKIENVYRGKFFIKEIIRNIRVRRHWVYASHNKRRLSRLLSMLSLALSVFRSSGYILKNSPDVVIVQYPPMALPFSARFFAKLCNSKFIVTVSDLWPKAIHDLGVMDKKSKSYKVLLWLEKHLYQSTDLCLAQSAEIADYIVQKTTAPVMLYRTGVNCDQFLPKLVYEPAHEKISIVYTGVLGIAHGLLNLCQSVNFEELGAELHIYGDGYEKKRLKQYLAKNPTRGVYLHEPVSNLEIPKILAKYDAALIAQSARIYGTVPSKMYEALAVGLPVLFHGAGEGATIIEGSKAGLVSSPHNFDDLKCNIKKLKNMSEEEHKLMGQYGRGLAVDDFNRQKIIKSFLKELEGLLNHGVVHRESVEVHEKPKAIRP